MEPVEPKLLFRLSPIGYSNDCLKERLDPAGDVPWAEARRWRVWVSPYFLASRPSKPPSALTRTSPTNVLA